MCYLRFVGKSVGRVLGGSPRILAPPSKTFLEREKETPNRRAKNSRQKAKKLPGKREEILSRLSLKTEQRLIIVLPNG